MRRKLRKHKKRLIKKFSKRTQHARKFSRLDLGFLFDFDLNDAESDVNDFKFGNRTAMNIGSGGIFFMHEFDIPSGSLLKFKFWKKSWHRYKNGFIKPDWLSAGAPKFVVGEVIRSTVVGLKFEIAVKFTSCNFRWLYYNKAKKHVSTL